MENLSNWEKIGKHLNGEQSPEEMESFLQWLNSDDKNKAELEEGKKLWEISELGKTNYSPNVQNAWMRFQNKVLKPQADDTPDNIPVFKLSKTFVLKIAAVFLVVFGMGYIVSLQFAKEVGLEIQTAVKETKEITLPDGSQVWLNKNSKISYSEDFNIKNRIVKLSGEAFFAVKKAEGNPFTILTNNSKTEVLGTEFNVRGYDNDLQVQVTVLEGKVSFSSKNNEEKIYLLTGEKGQIQANNTIQKTKSENLNELAWRTKKLTFENTHLRDVLTTLESYFDTKITVNNINILNCRFTGNFTDSNIQEVLEILSVSVDLTYQQQGNSYLLKGLGCK